MSEQYAVGTVVSGRVTAINDFGYVIALDEGGTGFIHVSDMTHDRRVEDYRKLAEIGEVVRAKVLGFDPESQQVTLGRKQVQEDPWDAVVDKYPVGSRVTGSASKVNEFGVFVTLEEGVEGLVHVSQLPVKDATEMFGVGDPITARVSRVEPELKQIGLDIILETRELEVAAPPSSTGDDPSAEPVSMLLVAGVVILAGVGWMIWKQRRRVE